MQAQITVEPVYLKFLTDNFTTRVTGWNLRVFYLITGSIARSEIELPKLNQPITITSYSYLIIKRAIHRMYQFLTC